MLNEAWFAAWCDYSLLVLEKNKGLREKPGPRGARPPAIDNTELVDEALTLPESRVVSVRKGLTERYDYLVVPPLVWLRLVAWYGGGPPIKRVVIRSVSERRLSFGWHLCLLHNGNAFVCSCVLLSLFKNCCRGCFKLWICIRWTCSWRRPIRTLTEPALMPPRI